VTPDNAPAMHSNASDQHNATCRECGGAFTARKPWQAFCSVPCRNQFHHKRRSIEGLAKRVVALEAAVDELRRLINT
jgi:hypothetical protein